MTKTAIALIVDRSGSMNRIKEEAQGALDTFVTEQAEQKGKAAWTVVRFDDHYDQDVFMGELPEKITLDPRGMTALHDAVGRTVNEMAGALAAMKKQPKNVLVAILTDGWENASKEYSRETVAKLVKEKTDAGWTFVYLATGLDKWEAERQATGIGILVGNTVSVSRKDHIHGTHAVSSYVTDYRAGGQSLAGDLRANVAKNDPDLLEREDEAGDE